MPTSPNRLAFSVLPALFALFVLPAPVPAQKSPWEHVDKRHGFSVRRPAKWSVIPIRTGEKWILAKFLSHRKQRVVIEGQGFTSEHTPVMRVLVFPHEVELVERRKDGDTTWTSIKNPYRDYADYLKRHFQGGGYFVSKEDERTIRGMKTTYQEIKVEKLSQYPRRYLVMTYHLEDRDMVVEVNVAEAHYQATSGSLKRALRTLKVFEPDPALASSQGSPAAPPGFVMGSSDEDLDKKLAERTRAWRLRVLDEAAKNLPKGWKRIKTKHFLILTHASPKHTSYIRQQAEAVRKWLDKTFKDLGDGKVLPAVIRICKDSDEERAYLSGSGDNFAWDTGEVVCAGGAWMLSDFSTVAYGLTLQYLSEKNPALWRALPSWLSSGLASHVQDARISKTRGFSFFPDVYELRHARQLVAEKRLIPAKDLLTRAPGELSEGRVDGFRDVSTMQYILVRYLMEGPGKKGKTKGLVQEYMKQALASLKEMDRDQWKSFFQSKATTKAPMTEEEEEEELKRRQSSARDWGKQYSAEREAILKDIYERTFADWTPADWARLDRALERYIQTGLKR